MQIATYELYYLPKGAEKSHIYPRQRNHTVCVKFKFNTIFSSYTIKGKFTQNLHSFDVRQFKRDPYFISD